MDQYGRQTRGQECESIGSALKLSSDGTALAMGSYDSYDHAGHVEVYNWSEKFLEWVQLCDRIIGSNPRNNEMG